MTKGNAHGSVGNHAARAIPRVRRPRERRAVSRSVRNAPRSSLRASCSNAGSRRRSSRDTAPACRRCLACGRSRAAARGDHPSDPSPRPARPCAVARIPAALLPVRSARGPGSRGCRAAVRCALPARPAWDPAGRSGRRVSRPASGHRVAHPARGLAASTRARRSRCLVDRAGWGSNPASLRSVRPADPSPACRWTSLASPTNRRRNRRTGTVRRSCPYRFMSRPRADGSRAPRSCRCPG